MKYTFRRMLETVDEILEAINRPDIPPADVTLTREGGIIEIDFNGHTLTPEEEDRLEQFLKGLVRDRGHITTDVNGDATITFLNTRSLKPVIQLTPECDPNKERINAQIFSWVMNGSAYTGCTIKTSDDGGKDAPNVIVHYAVV